MTVARGWLVRATRLALLIGLGALVLALVTALCVWAVAHISPAAFAPGSLGTQLLRLFYTVLEPVFYLSVFGLFGCLLLLAVVLLFGVVRR